MDLYYYEGSCFSWINVEGIGLYFRYLYLNRYKICRENSYFCIIGRKADKRKRGDWIFCELQNITVLSQINESTVMRALWKLTNMNAQIQWYALNICNLPNLKFQWSCTSHWLLRCRFSFDTFMTPWHQCWHRFTWQINNATRQKD